MLLLNSKVLSLSLATAFAANCLALTPVTLAWSKVYPYAGRAVGITTDTSGNVYSLHTERAGAVPIWVVEKFDSYGTQGWNEGNFFLNYSSARGIKLDAANNIYVYGNASFGPVIAAAGVIYKLNPQGYTLWVNQFTGDNDSWNACYDVGFDSAFNAYPVLNETIGGKYTTIGASISPNGSVKAGQVGVQISDIESKVGPGPSFAVTGTSSDGQLFAELLAGGAFAFGEDFPKTVVAGTTTTGRYLTAFDPTGLLYVLTQTQVYTGSVETDTYTLRAFDSNGNVIWSTAPQTGYITSDLLVPSVNTIYYKASSSGVDTLYSISQSKVNWKVALANGGQIVADDTGGVFVISNTATGAAITKYNADGSVGWATSYSPQGSTGIVDFKTSVRNGALNLFGTAQTSTSTEVFLAKFTQGLALSNIGLTHTTVLGNQTFQGVVTLNAPAPATGFTVSLSSGDPAHVGVPSTVTVPAGKTSAIFNYVCGIVDVATPVQIAAKAAGCARGVSVILNPYPLSGVSLGVPTIKGGGSVNGTVTLAGPAGTLGRWVGLTSDHPAIASVPAAVYVAPGATTANFTVVTKTVAASTSVNIGAVYSGVSKSFALSVTP